ncbi:MAG TPA: chemotaxis protein CheW, partial [Burkholderiaceae bacterium]|nr:chemotaxis protein CheW [Burkholderiaceae bacterium]
MTLREAKNSPEGLSFVHAQPPEGDEETWSGPASPHDEAPRGSVRYGFELAGLHLVPARGVLTELVAEARVFPVPRAADAVAGVINLHGTIVPVLDADPAGAAAADLRPARRRALVFDREEQRIAVLLQGAPRLLTLLPGAGAAPRP